MLKDYSPEIEPYLSDRLILEWSIEIGYFLEQAEACGSCPGLDKCRYQGSKSGLRYDEAAERVELVGYGACKRRVANSEIRKLGDYRLPAAFKNMTFETFKSSPQLRDALFEAKRVANGNGYKGIFLFGNTGTGKTHLGVSILQSRMKDKLPGVYITITDLMRRLKNFSAGNTETILEVAKQTPFLLLDDLGAERGSAYEATLLFEILNHRAIYRRIEGNPKGLITVITSNYDPNSLADKLVGLDGNQKSDPMMGNRIVSRIAEMCEMVEMKSGDYRVLGEAAVQVRS
jgi:DNA replication protein